MITTDVLVVGGGPAGLTAAVAAARAGASVILAEEHPELGGQLRYRRRLITPPGELSPVSPRALRDALLKSAESAQVDLRPGTVAWGWFDDGTVGATSGNQSLAFQPTVTIVASGSTDLPLIFPGATLPGVFTSRAVQILINHHKVLPGRRWAIVGGHDMHGEVAHDLRVSGGEVVATAGHVAMVSAHGSGGVQRITIDGISHDVDAIAVCAGRQPDAAIAMMAAQGFAHDAAAGGLVPVAGQDGRLGDSSIFVTGDAAGVTTVEVALVEAELVGYAAAAAVGHTDANRVNAAADAARARNAALADRHRRRAAYVALHAQPYQ